MEIKELYMFISSHVHKTPFHFSLYIRTSMQTYKHIFQNVAVQKHSTYHLFHLFALSGDHIALRHKPTHGDESYFRVGPLQFAGKHPVR